MKNLAWPKSNFQEENMGYTFSERVQFHKHVFWYAIVGCFIIFAIPDKGQAAPMPEFTTTVPDQWINSKPLQTADLKGKVILLEIWTSI
ncbi:MAG: hypothetical protein HQM14_11595 [SAR324 cluster bacterium]|nr:hypothetical protein [SAR324 cluster bacterium]